MLMQSHTGIIRIFPAIPEKWSDVSFKDLRAMGGFLVSATRTNGEVAEFTIRATVDGTASYLNPYTDTIESREMRAGEIISINK